MNSKSTFDSFFRGLNYSNAKPRKGDVLISEPFLSDPNFERSVILLVNNDADGSVGFILNDLSHFRIGEIISGFPLPDCPVYLGGPVGKQHLFILHTLGEIIPNSVPVSQGLSWGGDFEQITTLAEQGIITAENVKYFVGYSGWANGQLQKEITEKSWITGTLNVRQIMSHKVEQLWRQTLNGMGDSFRILANFPKDPALN